MDDLEALYRRIAYEMGDDGDRAPVRVVAADGERYSLLSLNWDRETRTWLLIVDPEADRG